MMRAPALAFAAVLSVLTACRASKTPNSISLDATSVVLVATSQWDYFYQPSKTVMARFHGAGVVVGILPGQDMGGWLGATATLLQGDLARIEIVGVPYGLAPGRYDKTLRVFTGDADGTNLASVDLPVSLTVPQVVTPARLVATLVTGATGSQPVQTLSLEGAAITWEALASDPWITLSQTSGTGAASLDVTFAPGSMAPGDYQGSVTIRDTLTGLSLMVPVKMGIEARRFLVPELGVGLVQVGAKDRVVRGLSIGHNSLQATAWQAASDQDWLQLSPSSGTTDGTLTLTADTSSLVDGLHYARVTVSEPAGSSMPATIMVGLFVDRSWTGGDLVTVALPSMASHMAADPIRPYFYFTQGDGQVEIYNSQTGAPVAPVSVPGASLTELAAAQDGSVLYALEAATGRIFPIDLATLGVGTPLTGASPAQTLAWARVDGRDVLFTNLCQAIDATTGALLADFSDSEHLFYATYLAANPDGHALYVQGGTNSNHDLGRLEMSARSGVFSISETNAFNEPGDGHGVIADFSGSRIYTDSPASSATGVHTGGNIYDATTMAPLGTFTAAQRHPTPAPDGRVLVSPASTWSQSDPFHVDAVAPDMTVQSGTQQVQGQLLKMLLSGDGHRLGLLVNVSYERKVTFIDAP